MPPDGCLQESVEHNPNLIAAKNLEAINEEGTLRLTGCHQLPLLQERMRLLREARHCAISNLQLFTTQGSL